jgi:hypothetical protein
MVPYLAGVVGLVRVALPEAIPTQIDLEDRYPSPLGDTPIIGNPDRI